MRRYGAFEIAAKTRAAVHEARYRTTELRDVASARPGRSTPPRPAPPPVRTSCPTGTPDPDSQGRRPVGVAGRRRHPPGFPHALGPARVLVLHLGGVGLARRCAPRLHTKPCPPIRARARPARAAVDLPPPDPDPHPFGELEWLDELPHTNPVWIHPTDAARLAHRRTGDLLRVETAIGYFVAKAWMTEGIRPGVVACSHHMGRWKLTATARSAPAAMTATVDLRATATTAGPCTTRRPVSPYRSADPDTARIWWTDTGVHQNLTFPVHPDPISGMHCWHQAVRVRPAAPGDAHGDIAVDTAEARADLPRSGWR